MTSTVHSVANNGLHCQTVIAEADVSRRIPGFILIGLPDAAVQEARDRIRSALENSGYPFPRTKVTVNLAPASVKKIGSRYDLAIAISILQAQGVCTGESTDRLLFIGELGLDGSLRPVSGALLAAQFAKKSGYQGIIVPRNNAREAAYVRGIRVLPAEQLSDVVNHLTGSSLLDEFPEQQLPESHIRVTRIDFSEIQGQEHAKRALEIAAAGGHNVLLNGVPGSGKTMLAKAFPSILPPLSHEEILEVSEIYSSAGLLSDAQPLIIERQVRSPHHTSSMVSIVGGGSFPRPGEITLAHRGVLFFDEMPEFPRNVLEALRQPLEDNVVSISRASGSVTFPANFVFIGAQNPCPCGSWGDPEKTCLCTEHRRRQYRQRISGPLLDRIDIHVRVNAVKRDELLSEKSNEHSKNIRERIGTARKIQSKRFGRSSRTNASMSTKEVKRFCPLADDVSKSFVDASKTLKLSARSFFKVVRVARTIADLENEKDISRDHILEALQYRAPII